MEEDEFAFSVEDISFLNMLVTTILESGTFIHKKDKKILNNLKSKIEKTTNVRPEKLEANGKPVYHLFYVEGKIYVDVFIYPYIYSIEGREEHILGKVIIEFVKREKVSLGLKAFLPKVKKEVMSNSLTVIMLREGLETEIEKIFEWLNPKLCGKGYGWFFASYVGKGTFEEKKSRIVVPFPLIFYYSKKSYQQRPRQLYQMNVVKLLSSINIDYVEKE